MYVKQKETEDYDINQNKNNRSLSFYHIFLVHGIAESG